MPHTKLLRQSALAKSSTLLLASSLLLASTTSAQTTCQSITEIACAKDSGFQVLCEALHVTKLDVALDGPGPWTVFAPTDAAFGMLSEDLLDPMRIFRDNLEYLVLTHAIAGQVAQSFDLECDSEWEMASQQETTTVVCRDNGLFIQGQGNSAQDTPMVVTADIKACNGIIHVIDAVLLP